MAKQNPIQVGDVMPTNKCGYVEVIAYKSANCIKVVFLETGGLAVCTARNLRAGEVKDNLSKSVHGIGFIGSGQHKSREGGKLTKAYSVWSGMIARCYCQITQEKNPTYKGCSVVECWHNFQNFADWYYGSYPKDGLSYELDKDLKVPGNKIYGPDTCAFIEKKINAPLSVIREFQLVDPLGVLHSGSNVLQFCQNHKLTASTVYGLLSGRYRQHKGWHLPGGDDE